jgi:penicillin-binding protein A
MLTSTHRIAVAVMVTLGLTVSAIAFAATGDQRLPPKKSAASREPASQPAAIASLPSDLVGANDPRNFHQENNLFISDLKGGKRAVSSLDAGLQNYTEEIFRKNRVPYGAVVAMEPATGRLLAFVSHSSANQKAGGDVAFDASAPAASVFKIITAAALVDARVNPEQRVCYKGGFHYLDLSDLIDDPRRDAFCTTFQEAMGGSINAVFAKLADRYLTAQTLERYASAFGFGHTLPFDARAQTSRAEIPSDRLEFARTAAGFWHTRMSPLHGALIASTIANDGVMPRVSIVDRIVDSSGKVVRQFQPKRFRQVVPRSTARIIGHMMQRTVTNGTARRAFHDSNGRSFLPDIQVAGKTGTLTQSQPYRAYNWWVGYAPADKPTIAVAALVVNDPLWRIKASYTAREALRYYLVTKK